MKSYVLLLICFITLSVYAQPADDAPIITPENAGQVKQLAQMGQGVIWNATDSPDGRTLAIATTTGIWLYDIQNLDAPPRLLSSHTGRLEYTPNSRYIALYESERVTILDAQTGDVLNSLGRIGAGFIHQVTFTPNTQRMFITQNDIIRVYDTLISEQFAIITPIAEDKLAYASIIDIAPSRNGKTLIISTYEGLQYLRVWDVETQTVTHTIENVVDPQHPQRVEYSPTGDMWLSYAMGQQKIWLWDTSTHALIRTIDLDDYPQSVNFSPDGEQLVVSFWDETYLLDVQTATIRQVITQPLRPNESVMCDYRADMTGLLCQTNRRIYDNGFSDSYVRLIDPDTNTIQAEFFNPYILRVDADNLAIVTPENDALTLENPVTGDVYTTLFIERPSWLPMYPIWRYGRERWHYTPDLRRIVAYMPDRLFGTLPAQFHIWDVVTESLIVSIPMTLWRIADITTNSDGQWLIIAGNHSSDSERYDEVQVWDMQTGELVTFISLDTFLKVHRVFYADDEVLIVFDDTRFFRWNIRLDANTPMFAGYDGDYVAYRFGVDYNPATHLLAMGSFSGEMTLYDSQTGALLHKLTGHKDSVSSIDFTSDGRFIASSGLDGTVRVWGIP
ncbi:MAG: WD40 repeat domain-containing protein [Anaerolineae bacterium]|nr:WD40 repeat domain-containing protein [Anaerolineae bacterium]